MLMILNIPFRDTASDRSQQYSEIPPVGCPPKQTHAAPARKSRTSVMPGRPTKRRTLIASKPAYLRRLGPSKAYHLGPSVAAHAPAWTGRTADIQEAPHTRPLIHGRPLAGVRTSGYRCVNCAYDHTVFFLASRAFLFLLLLVFVDGTAVGACCRGLPSRSCERGVEIGCRETGQSKGRTRGTSIHVESRGKKMKNPRKILDMFMRASQTRLSA